MLQYDIGKDSNIAEGHLGAVTCPRPRPLPMSSQKTEAILA